MARAGTGVDIEITGVAELDRKFARMPKRLQKKLTRKATRKSARDIVLPDAKAMAPRDEGDLEKSLTVRSVPRSRKQFGHRVQTRDGFFQGDEYYAGFQEFGWDDKPEGDPFLRPALYSNEGRIRKTFKVAVGEFIREEKVIA